MYDHRFAKVKDFWFEIMIALDSDFAFQDDLIQEKIFKGGKYLTYDTSLSQLVSSWMKVNQYVSANKIASGNHQWVEVWKLNNWRFTEKGIMIMYPLV
ncbi:hypothetical protein [Clostridium sp. E02]|uniref:hypothetical protein n=1 Tax=Clostridium sp. E02 TaxID=2487134 RepID=UPI000F547CC1|nr:hypothetical protein [Clostridium sp. E02]